MDERIESEIVDLSEITAQAVGNLADRARTEFDEQAGTIELLKRELGVLRGEVGVEHELRELRSSIAKAQRMVPQVPTIIAGLRDEAANAKDEADRKIAGLRKAVKDVQHAIAEVRVEQGCVNSAVKRGLGQEVEVEWEATSRSARMVVRPAMHPDAAKTLREFAGRVIDGTIVQH